MAAPAVLPTVRLVARLVVEDLAREVGAAKTLGTQVVVAREAAVMASAIVLGDATVNDATETEAIIAALASQYNTTTVQDAGAEVPCTPP